MKYLIFAFTILFGFWANAYVVPTYRDLKPATQIMIEKQVITAPVVASATRLTNAAASSASLVTTISTFSAQPDVPRNIVVTTGGTTASCTAGNVVVSGTNIYGKNISESLAITSAQNGATTGAKAFKSVSSVVIPIQSGGAGCTYSVGIGSLLGMKACMDSAGYYFQGVLGGVFEATRATIAANATLVESNTASLNGTLNGSKDVILFFAQNFTCHP